MNTETKYQQLTSAFDHHYRETLHHGKNGDL